MYQIINKNNKNAKYFHQLCLKMFTKNAENGICYQQTEKQKIQK